MGKDYTYTKDELAKIGNTIVYLAQRINDLSKTKLLKLLYLLEERAVSTLNLPFLDLKFEVWSKGPVSKDIFIELSEGRTKELVLLKDFIKVEIKDENTYIKPTVDFCDNEFSDNEIELLESIVTEFGKNNASKLVDFTHKEESLWYKLAQENNLLKSFSEGTRTSSNIEINFEVLLQDEESRSYYNSHREYNNMLRQVNK